MTQLQSSVNATLAASLPSLSPTSSSSSSSSATLARVVGRRKASKVTKIRARPFNGKLSQDIMLTSASTPEFATTTPTSSSPLGASADDDISGAQSTLSASLSSTSSLSSSTLASSPVLKITTLRAPIVPSNEQLVNQQRQQQHQTSTNNNNNNSISSSSNSNSYGRKPKANASLFSQTSNNNSTLITQQPTAERVDSKLATSKTQAHLSCASGEMELKLTFNEPFKGIVYANQDRRSPCKLIGDGARYYELKLPLTSCGTRQLQPRVFANDVFVRFHKSLELEGDELKTLICRYPAPLAPLPPIQLPSDSQGSTNKTRPNDTELEIEGVPPIAFVALAGDAASPSLVQPIQPPPPSPSQQLPLPPVRKVDNEHQTRNSTTLPTVNRQLQFAHVDDSFDLISLANQRPTISNGRLKTAPSEHAFLDKLTGVELLLFVSSVIFFVLLSLGILGGYLCFAKDRRRRHLRAAGQQSLLRRNHLQRPTVSVVGGNYAQTLHHAHQQPRYIPTPSDYAADAAWQHQHAQQQQQQQQQQQLQHRNLYTPTSLQQCANQFRFHYATSPTTSMPMPVPLTSVNKNFFDANAYFDDCQQQYHQNQQLRQRQRQRRVAKSLQRPHRKHAKQACERAEYYFDTDNELDVRQLRRRASSTERFSDHSSTQSGGFGTSRLVRPKSTTDVNESSIRHDETQLESSNNDEQESKIFVKNIEDSYLTNYTEILERDYLSHDLIIEGDIQAVV